jgi:apolipoprotein N-acyltransferase
MVLWPEMAGGGLEEETQALMARAKEVAQKENIYLAMGIQVLYPDDDRKMENRFVLVAPSGEVIIDHDKYGAIFVYSLFPTGPAVQGEYVLQTADTPFGRLSGIVCWDADFPMTVRQAGDADILFITNGDNRGHYKEHAQMAVFRAIENGVSLVRQDWKGLSLATDPYGRILSMVDLSAAAEPVMSVQVPTRGVFTIYPIIGDLFGWLSVVGFVVLAGWGIFQRRQSRNTEANSTEV